VNDDPRRLLEQYIADVQHPDVSAFELLDLLQTRSVLATLEAQLSTDERQRLEDADSQLFAAAPVFLSRLLELAPLPTLRRRANVSPSHWWWYLDRLQPATRT
jgi:hypothetical protein